MLNNQKLISLRYIPTAATLNAPTYRILNAKRCSSRKKMLPRLQTHHATSVTVSQARTTAASITLVSWAPVTVPRIPTPHISLEVGHSIVSLILCADVAMQYSLFRLSAALYGLPLRSPKNMALLFLYMMMFSVFLVRILVFARMKVIALYLAMCSFFSFSGSSSSLSTPFLRAVGPCFRPCPFPISAICCFASS